MLGWYKIGEQKLHYSANSSQSIAVQVRLQQAPTIAPKKILPKQKEIKKEITDLSKTSSDQGENSALAQYLSNVRQIINERKYYPTQAKRLQQQGIVKIKLELNNLGEILSMNLVEKSRHSLLNQAVIETIQQIKHFGIFPKEMAQNKLEVTVPIAFELI